MDLAKEHNLIQKDNAQGIGADYTHRDGSKQNRVIGFNFIFSIENLGYGDGGAIFTNDDALLIALEVHNHGKMSVITMIEGHETHKRHRQLSCHKT
jgi:dTDP-4-amino-4,6-dideoxygalactose transaminase